jgi:hypothetical protein
MEGSEGITCKTRTGFHVGSGTVEGAALTPVISQDYWITDRARGTSSKAEFAS